MTIDDTLTEPGIAADVAAKLENHPFFRRLQETEPTPSGDASDSTPTANGEGVVEPSSENPDPLVEGQPPVAPVAPAAPAAPATETATTASTYRYVDGDQSVELSDDQIRTMVALNQWAAGIPEPVARQFGAIEQGIAVAVPTDEYARYQAWLASQSGQAPRSAAPTSVPAEWDLDPEAQQAFAALQAENAALAQQADLARRQAATSLQPAVVAEQERIIATFDKAVTDYAAQYGITVDQANSLLDAATNANIIGNLVDAQRVYSPSGVMVRDADFATVARQALDFGRLQHPDLATFPSIVAGAPGAAAPAPTPNPVAPTVSVESKKARAASLAAAPSAATVPPGYNPTAATPQQQRDAMAQFLRDQGAAS
jgi:hypothetical protein